jgi:carbamoyl-phosphate synthase large subunit
LEGRELHVLTFPGGSEIAMEVRESLVWDKHVRVFGASGDRYDGGDHLYTRYCQDVPHVRTGDDCLRRLNQLVVDWKIDFVVPCHDDALLFLSESRAELACKLVASSRELVRTFRSKRRTLETMRGHVPTPLVYGYEQLEAEFPGSGRVFVKPDVGQGSFDTHLIDVGQLARFKARQADYVFLEYLPGEEYTVDCLSGANGELLAALPRIRNRTKAGIAVFTSPVQDTELAAIAARIASRCRLVGSWFFQMKRDADQRLKLLEIGPRIAGAMALHRQYGVNFPLLSLYVHAGIPVRVELNDAQLTMSRTLSNHFRSTFSFEHVFVDLDDTLILRGAVNTKLIALLYQWLNAGKTLHLITRCKEDPLRVLERYKLGPIFSRVIHLRNGESKADHVLPGSIFIDDSFSERSKVRGRLGIPTFDLSMLDCLIDERR